MYAILDIESTGGKFNEEGITEIAIHKFDGEDVVDRFISLVNPEKPIQPFVAKLTGINNNMLRTAPKFHEVAKRIIEITEDCVLVAHNAQFDYRILRTEFRRLGYDYQRKTLCTVDLSKLLLPDAESYSLGKLVRSLGIPVSDRHRANGDALATLKLLQLLLLKDTEKTILKTAIRKEAHGELSEKQLDMVRGLPDAIGVFYMHNKDGEIIYLKDSENIRKRVNQWFTNPNDRARKLGKETKKVSFERTGNSLMAQLKALKELQKNKPKFNQPHQRPKALFGLKSERTPEGYLKIGVGKRTKKNEHYGRYPSAVSANNALYRLTKEFGLCDKLSGLSEAKGACGKYTDNKCLGACIGKEHKESYNNRVQQALSKFSLKDKNVLLLDRGRQVGEQSVLMVRNGIPIGTAYTDLNYQKNNIHILEQLLSPIDASEMAYLMIETYLRKNTFIKEIPLPSKP